MESRQYIYNQSTLTVKFGNIIDSHADVIVSSDDSCVTMGGGVSRAILRAGGDAIIKDAKKMTPVRLGDVIVTTAGGLLHQKYVYCRKRSIPTHSERFYPPTIIAEMGLKRA